MQILFITIKRNWPFALLASVIFLLLLLFVAANATRPPSRNDLSMERPLISLIPSRWEFFEQYIALNARDGWLLLVKITDVLWILFFVFIFFLNFVLMMEMLRNRRRLFAINLLAYPLGLFTQISTLLGCYGGGLIVVFLGLGTIVSVLTPFTIYLRVFLTVFFGLNFWLMFRAIKKIYLS